ncbi:ATP-binding protein [Pseudomarimonas salicorniae]|uniref:histidine kinase n=1 Tax=Pseudomarimonas salicorniae TaxID=2933270 RepID=A0ABT0GHA7_9GAMM|nr:ATP-binding protein [Lysobacter sp. CAU 1642]MCK7593920.1 ATP-binding protein [Lysobacter sp. CAU 1642]
MPLRLQLALVSLCLLLLPWGGWQVLQQMESLLRQGQEETLEAVADSLRRALGERPGLLPPAAPRWFAQPLPRQPRLDGQGGDWGSPVMREFADDSGSPRLRVALGRHEALRLLLVQVRDPTPQRADAHWPRAARSDHLQLLLDGPNGALRMRLANAASGALVVTSNDGSPSWLRLAGEWQEIEGGYRVELMLPSGWPITRLGLVAVDVDSSGAMRRFGQVDGGGWPIWEYREEAEQLLRGALPEGIRAQLVDGDGWIYARAGELPPAESDPLPWWRRQLWYALAWADEPLDHEAGESTRDARREVQAALGGAAGHAWRRDTRAPRLLLASAVPLQREGEPVAALWLQREQQTLLLADRALSGLLLSSLLAMGLAAAVLLGFATRLSQRIRRLRNGVENALSKDGGIQGFTPSRAGDEVGDLSRSFARLLADIGASQAYLQSLAGKLSHELNTPLAVVRGSLDNIDTTRLDEGTAALLQRARGGSDRLAAIVRAMSEASRVEQAIAGAEGEDVELVGMLRQCAEGYRALLAPRRLELSLPDGELWLHCSPELLVQALDKLVDNARGFCPADGWVRLSLERGLDGPQIVLANSGPTLPEAIRGRLFESLVSQRPGSHKQGVHLGFGLFIVRLVTELHGGRAEAGDLPGGDGVEFVLSLRGMPRR